MFEQIISLIAPNECLSCDKEGSPLCYKCSRRLPSPLLHKQLISPDTLQVATIYSGNAKEIVHSLKFSRSRASARVIAQIMCDRLSAPSGSIVTYVPTATARVRMRGYDQAALIAQHIARAWKLPYAPLLTRSGQQRQVGKTRQERRSQSDHLYRPINNYLPSIRPIILVDDVLTTGSTIEAATRALRQAHATTIHALVFASA